VRYDAGQAAWNRGDYDQAFRDYNAAIAANQCYAPAHWGLAKVYVQMAGKWGCLVGQEHVPCGEAAYAELRLATEGCEGNMQGLGPGDIDQINRMKDPLAKSWKERHYRMDASAALARGKKHQEAGDLAAAESDYRSVIGLYRQLNVNEGDCDYMDAYDSLGDILGERGRYDEAIAALQAAHNTPCGSVIGGPGSAVGTIIESRIQTLRDKRDGVKPVQPSAEEPKPEVAKKDDPAEETPETEASVEISPEMKKTCDRALPLVQKRLAADDVVKKLDAQRGTIPRDFLLGWIAAESEGKFNAAPTAMGERGYFQISPDDWCFLQRAGKLCQLSWNPITKTFLLPDIEKGFEKLSTDKDYSLELGVKMVQMDASDLRGLKRGFDEQSNPDLFWHLVKLVHAVSLHSVTKFTDQMLEDGVKIDSWDAVRTYVSDKDPRILKKATGAEISTWVQREDKVFYYADKLDEQ
jgi:hypothetical protein